MTRYQVAGSLLVATAAGTAVGSWAVVRGMSAGPSAGVVATAALGLLFLAVLMRYNVPTAEPRELIVRRMSPGDAFDDRQAVLMKVFVAAGAMLALCAAIVALFAAIV